MIELTANTETPPLLLASRARRLDGDTHFFVAFVQVIDNFSRNHKLGNLFEARVGPGKLLVCTMELPRIADKSPAANQLLKSLYAYAGSASFKPAQLLDVAVLDQLLGSKSASVLQKIGAKVHADSEAHGYEATLAIDGDPDTCWHTKWEPAPAPMPHELVIDLGQEVTLTGITYLPRQDMANGRIAECEVFADNVSVATAKWPNNAKLQTLRFKQLVTARHLNLQIKSEVNGQPFASVAEFDILPAK